jgi:dihydropyrimidinase
MTTSKAFAIVRSLSRRLTWLAALALALPAHVAAQQQPETVIRNGLIVTAEGRLEADVRIRGEIIVEIGPSLAAGAGARQIDAKGMLLLPGAVDTHTHLNSVMPDPPRPDGNQDDYVSGSAAGFAGGVTTVSNFRGLLSGEDEDAYAARVIGAIEANGMADVFIHVNAGNDPTPFGRDRLKALVERGFVSTGEDFMARSGYDHHALEWYQTHEESGKVGVLSMMHAEDFAILQGTRDRLMAEGKGSIHNFAQSAPDVAEVVAVQRVVAIAEATGAPMYILHISSGRALQVAEDAMARGLPVYVEARPMYLHLTQEVYQRPDVGLYLGGPPIRDQWDQDKLWEGIAKGTVHTIGTDHTGYSRETKLDTTQTIASVHAVGTKRLGTPNLQEYLPMMFSEGVLTSRITLEQFVAVTSTNAAPLFGFYPRKGTIQVGSDADIVIWDPTITKQIREEDLLSGAGYSAYEGWEVTGFPRTTIRRGEIVYDNGVVLAEPGSGKFIPGAPFERPVLRPVTNRR